MPVKAGTGGTSTLTGLGGPTSARADDSDVDHHLARERARLPSVTSDLPNGQRCRSPSWHPSPGGTASATQLQIIGAHPSPLSITETRKPAHSSQRSAPPQAARPIPVARRERSLSSAVPAACCTSFGRVVACLPDLKKKPTKAKPNPVRAF